MIESLLRLAVFSATYVYPLVASYYFLRGSGQHVAPETTTNLVASFVLLWFLELINPAVVLLFANAALFYTLRLGFAIYLLHPRLHGGEKIYALLIGPWMEANAEHIDRKIEEHVTRVREYGSVVDKAVTLTRSASDWLSQVPPPQPVAPASPVE